MTDLLHAKLMDRADASQRREHVAWVFGGVGWAMAFLLAIGLAAMVGGVL